MQMIREQGFVFGAALAPSVPTARAANDPVPPGPAEGRQGVGGGASGGAGDGHGNGGAGGQGPAGGGQEKSAGGGQGTSGPGKSSGPFSQEPPFYLKVAGHAKKVSEVLGEIVWLMSQSRASSGRCATGHKQFFISDLEWPVADATTQKVADATNGEST